MNLLAIQRFPKPEFESGYMQPPTSMPFPRAEILAWMDVAVLILALTFISWMVLKKRSRKGVFWISIFSLAYFGFYREGCVCSIGSIQNMALALFDVSYTIPATIVLFFLLPLVYTLFFGRTFCAGVCPFGAMQDLVALSPQRLSSKLNAILGLIPYFYLGLTLLYATTGTDFLICRYDPFVGIFRFNASLGMFVFAAILLLSGVFIARPYCRFLCPYGVLLNWVSRFSKKHLTITPSNCIQCRLCENSCPYDAIDFPVTGALPESKKERSRRLMLISLLIPGFMFLGGFLGGQIHERLATVNSKVRLALIVSDPQQFNALPESYEIKAFKSSGKTPEQLYAEVIPLLRQFKLGGWILGAFMGLSISLMITSRLRVTHRSDYIPNKGTCFSCTRCVDYCPIK